MIAQIAQEYAAEIRELQSIAELEEAERLQLQVWGRDTTYDSKDLMRAIRHEGGLVAGAFVPGAGLVGYVFGFPTRDPRVQHSHRLGVLEEWRRHGLGARLKWYQRAWCLERGIEVVRWTYDPLRVANADLNVRRLGVTATAYLEDYYGPMPGINAGTPSDRVLVEWMLTAPRVIERLASPPQDRGFPDAPPANQVIGGKPGAETLGLEATQVSLSLPDNFANVLAHDLPLAIAWRLHVRRLLSHYFGRSYRITEFTVVGGPAYILEK